jgi:4-diphosphocytidyl-2-C-methyl-D-erythritol kinase
MLTFPNAKINIGLHITEKRPDGFHNLESCFYPVGWSDVLEILPAEKLSFKSTGIPIPGNPETNLCLKAYHLVKQDFDIPPVMIHLHKVVPIGAGMGGGSADCAFTIKTLNELFELHLTNEQMENYARTLGSDCAFFIQNRPQYCFGKGDEFSEIALDLSGKYIVLVNPNIHISTAEAYSGVKPVKVRYLTPSPSPAERGAIYSQNSPLNGRGAGGEVLDLKEILQKPVNQWVDVVKNDFENHLLPKYPTIANIKNTLYTQGAEYACMTGSGSTVFGIFEKEIDLQEIFAEYSVWQGKL